jgi:predicted ATPase
MIRKFGIKNYKSILDHTIELGRFNVFIGENGCGKTNILEAMAMASAALEGKLDVEGLYSKGVRVAKPSLTLSSFAGHKPAADIQLRCDFFVRRETNVDTVEFVLSASEESLSVTWADRDLDAFMKAGVAEISHSPVVKALRSQMQQMQQLFAQLATTTKSDANSEDASLWAKMLEVRNLEPILDSALKRLGLRDFLLAGFAIYNIHALALRGIENVSKKTPLGIHGESLDVLVASFDKAERGEILRRAKMISWLGDVIVDAGDELKFRGYKLGRSASTLYFKDKFMRRSGNIFSAENANEGILHVLFYLALFISKDTPTVFGIDNVETALNPQLCRDLVKELAELAKAHGKQALITTHNPAVLDGLNLHDDEQRLFVVSRNDEGHTVTRRVKVKPEGKGPQGERLKLSELWMRGALGGIPQKF